MITVYLGSIAVGVVDTCVVTLVDPLPEDGLSHRRVGQQQSHNLRVHVAV